MKKIIQTLFVFSSFLLITIANAANTGVVSFNLGQSPVSDSPVQPVTLYGCNKTVNTDLFWDAENQVVGNLPYGWHQSESGKRYYVSQYYMASPPVFRKELKSDSTKKPPYIGLVTPDTFVFKGEKPAQIVYFDYRILEPTYLTYVPVDYRYKNENGDSCTSLGVDLIPINTQCENFPWRNGSLGAAGIGDITEKSHRIFLPLKGEEEKALQCKATVLDDILLDHEVYFSGEGGEKKKTISLTDYHNRNNTIKLMCFRRPENVKPSGCLPPEQGGPR